MNKSTYLYLALAACCAIPAHAQTSSGGLTFGLGSSGFGGLSTASAGAGGTSAAGATTGATALGGGNFGNFDAGFGATVLGGSSSSNLLGAAALSRTATGALGGLGGMSRMGGIGGMGGRGMNALGGQGMNNSQNQTKVRATVKIGFAYSSPSAAMQAEKINARLSRMPLPEKLSGVSVEMDGRTAIIRGQVPSAEDGQLIERLLSLEPGIDAVVNALELGEPAGLEAVPAPAPSL